MDAHDEHPEISPDGVTGEPDAHQLGTEHPVRLFQLSRQIDRLRDDARWLLRHAPDAGSEALVQAQERLAALFETLGELLDEDHRTRLSAELGTAAAGSLGALMIGAGQLAAWVDGVLLAPAFTASQRAQQLNVSVLESMAEDKTKGEGSERRSGATGQYL